MDKRVSIHTNRSLEHQVRVANSINDGFKRLGYKSQITENTSDDSDIHVVIGPHYAKQQNLNNRTLLLDRAFWGDPDYISLGWMQPDGGRVFAVNCPDDRPKPDLMPMKKGTRTLLLLDYGSVQTIEANEVRRHPSDAKPVEALREALSRNDIAVGGMTTALVDAAIHGLYTVALDPNSPIKGIEYYGREQWLNNLSYMNWNDTELRSGEALKHLCL